MKKTNTWLLAASFATLGLTACEKDKEVTILSAVSGDFIGKETCAPSPAGSQYAVHIYNTSENNGKVFIDNLYDIGNRFEGTTSGSTITLPSSPYSYVIPAGRPGAGTYTGTISATGSVSGSVLTMTFRATGDLADTCTFVGDRNFRNPAEGN